MNATPKTIEYATAVERGLKIMTRAGRDSWALGDLAANVETKYGKDTHRNLADDIGINYKTLLNYRTVARAYAPAERKTGNVFRVYEIFAALDNRAELVASRVWDSREAQAKLAEIKAGQVPPEVTLETKLAKAEEKVAKLRAALADAEAERDGIKAELAAKSAAPARTRNRKQAAAEANATSVNATRRQDGRPALHIVKGLPEHTAEDCTPACPQHANEAARRVRHARKAS